MTGGEGPNASPYRPPIPCVVPTKMVAGSPGSTRILLIARPVKVWAPMTSVVGIGLNGPFRIGAVSALSLR